MLDGDVPSSALDMVERLGLDEAAFEGYGPDYVRQAVLAAIPDIRAGLRSTNEQISMREGTGFSGATSGVFDKMRGQAGGQAVRQLGEVVTSAEAKNEAYASQAAGQVLGALTAHDQMKNSRDIAQMQIVAAAPDAWDNVFRGLTVASMFI